MINPTWLFVLAAVIAVLGILAAFKNFMGKVQQKFESEKSLNMQSLQKEQMQFFFKVALVEAIPILMIVYGFMLIDPTQEQSIAFPIILILAVLGFALLQVLNIRRAVLGYEEPPKELKTIVHTLLFIGIALMSAIPILSIVALLTMTQ
ncbi:hypothetical protein SAMN05192533_101391 [Mesobacillus persicus]|uniref:Uncharacterized protein n=1 Tax=Mesobacillus persicus TaxID=930146 RepID=A0A1H7WEW2_9BACI|nr:hypothetical protein [Mesobacillus persicus]SEM20031.1 hypothetical protein SAMN05192533_101391 [Mesobacillus persicus]